ncbi:MAG: thioredoxin domain-containing protein [Thermomicrobiales bacterium]
MPADSGSSYRNRLANETSPYLLQHQANPVDWYPWGEEAFARARAENKPILVSIGYSACHWCHVMAHESFEDEAIAAYLNATLIAIKVDREERPDVDAVYMAAVQAMTGQGGWPLNAFLTPDGVPFFAGTYWPPQARGGMPGFPDVLDAVVTAWTTNRDGVIDSADRVLTYLRQSSTATIPSTDDSGAELLTPALADDALRGMERSFDRVHGGFGNAPKFPQASAIEFLLRHARRTGPGSAAAMAIATLDHMANGGIHDQLGGGFARYAVDRTWLVPHFEKMLYDNGQLMSLYLDAWRLTGEIRHCTVAEGIADWVLREMTAPDGGFYAALDADSDGEEGAFYVWTRAEVDRVLGDALTPEEIDVVCLHFGIDEGGNFEGKTILSIVRPITELSDQLDRPESAVASTIARAKDLLMTAREARTHPARDEKVIAGWNGLMLKAFAIGGIVLDRPDLLQAAERNAGFILTHLRWPDGSLARSWRDGTVRGRGTLEDHAFLAEGLLALYTATGTARWLDEANTLLDTIRRDFRHESGVGFSDVSVATTELIVHPRDLQDGATPSGNAVTADLLLTLAVLRDQDELATHAGNLLRSLAPMMREHPVFMGRYLAVLERWLAPRRDLVLSGEVESTAFVAMRAALLDRYEPLLVVGYGLEAGDAMTERFPTLGARPSVPGADVAAWLCEGSACLPPVTEIAAMASLLDGRAGQQPNGHIARPTAEETAP